MRTTFRKFLLVILIVSFFAPLFAQYQVEQGKEETFGDWQYKKNYNLTNGRRDFEVAYVSIARYTGEDTAIIVPKTIGDYSVKQIDNFAFSGCENLESIILPSSLTTIGNYAFNGCVKLSEIVLPDSVIYIGDFAFVGCKELLQIVLPSSVEYLGNNVFFLCSKLDLFLDENGNEYAPSEDGFSVIGSIIVKYSGNAEHLVIPAEINGKPITTVDGQASFMIANIKSIDFSEGIKKINANTFGEAKIESVIFPETLEYIGNWSFGHCYKLAGVIIPESVKYIGDGAFFKNTSMTDIYLPEGVEEIGTGAFADCANLYSVTFLSKIKDINGYLFANCVNLKEVVLPVGVEQISSSVFLDCYSLERVVIPTTVKNIHDLALAGCKNLKEVVDENGKSWITENGDIVIKNVTMQRER